MHCIDFIIIIINIEADAAMEMSDWTYKGEKIHSDLLT